METSWLPLRGEAVHREEAVRAGEAVPTETGCAHLYTETEAASGQVGQSWMGTVGCNTPYGHEIAQSAAIWTALLKDPTVNPDCSTIIDS